MTLKSQVGRYEIHKDEKPLAADLGSFVYFEVKVMKGIS